MGSSKSLIPQVGDVLSGRYALSAELGRGAFGVVFRARQIGLDEDVAVKVLLPRALASPEARSRFHREVELSKGLRHPNTVRVLDVASADGDLPYYVMEFVEGSSVADALKRAGRFAVERVRSLAIQVLKALGEAHAMGVVHRDLKPANLMLTRVHGEAEFVKVLDFGIATSIGAGSSAPRETSETIPWGTPAYMSPEQVLNRPVDQRSDLYSLGLIMGELLSGTRLVKTNNIAEVLLIQASTAPLVLPPAVINSPLVAVIECATSKAPAGRYSSADEMRAALQRLHDHQRPQPLSRRPLMLTPPPPGALGAVPATRGPEEFKLTAPTPVRPGVKQTTHSPRPWRRYVLICQLALLVTLAWLVQPYLRCVQLNSFGACDVSSALTERWPAIVLALLLGVGVIWLRRSRAREDRERQRRSFRVYDFD